MSHICFVSESIHSFYGSGVPEGVGGAERQQYMLARELVKEGLEVSVVTIRREGVNRVEIHDGVEVWNILPKKRGLKNIPHKSISLFRALQQVDADIYYARGNDFLYISLSMLCRFHDASFVFAVANDANVEPSHINRKPVFIRPLYRYAIRAADAITALTPHQRDVLETIHGVEATVIPCGYDIPSEADILDHDERKYVLWVGRLDQDQKHPDRFIELARRLPDIQFVMIGPPADDDPNRSYFEKIRQEAVTLDNLEFYKFVPPNEIHEFFKQSMLLVNTSEYEGFGNVFLEAWRYATPVVTLNYTLHGVIDQEDVGVHAESLNDMQRTIASLVSDSDRRADLGFAGRDLVRDEYSIESITTAYRELFSEL